MLKRTGLSWKRRFMAKRVTRTLICEVFNVLGGRLSVDDPARATANINDVVGFVGLAARSTASAYRDFMDGLFGLDVTVFVAKVGKHPQNENDSTLASFERSDDRQYLFARCCSATRSTSLVRSGGVGHQIAIHQPLAGHRGGAGRHLVDGVHVTDVIPGGELIHVPLKVFGAELVERSLGPRFNTDQNDSNAVGVGLVPDHAHQLARAPTDLRRRHGCSRRQARPTGWSRTARTSSAVTACVWAQQDTVWEAQDFDHRIGLLQEISDRVHGCERYPNRLRIRGITVELLEILRQYLPLTESWSRSLTAPPEDLGTARQRRPRWVLALCYGLLGGLTVPDPEGPRHEHRLSHARYFTLT